MKKRTGFLGYFIIFAFLSVITVALSIFGFLKPVEPLFQVILAPVASVIYSSASFVTNLPVSSQIKNLKNENVFLTKKITDVGLLIKDNKALRDQFETQSIRTTNLIPAQIIGAPGFLPGLTSPANYILDKGEADLVHVGDAVIYKDNLIGIINKTTKYLSSVVLITSPKASFTAKTLESNATGVVKGQGGGDLILDNVVLSDNLKVGDTVLTKGDVGISGAGLVPNLIVGKIAAVSKSPSDLFQKAKIKSLIDFSRMEKVFVANY